MSALRKVLVVDDDPVVGSSFNRVLSNKGYVVVTAENAAQALEKMREQEYDVVFTDIKMPGMSGIELAEEVKARRPWTPVVIVTGYGSTAHEARARQVGVSAFLNKPLSPDMIEESAAQAVRESAPVAQVQPAEALPAPPADVRGRLLNMALFLAAPFIGLLYAVALPLVGGAMLASMAGRAFSRAAEGRPVLTFVKNTGLLLAAPFVGLVYAVSLPLVGMGMLLWTGAQAFMNKAEAQ